MNPPPQKPWDGASLLPPPVPAGPQPQPALPELEDGTSATAVRAALWACSGYVDGSRMLAERFDAARTAG